MRTISRFSIESLMQSEQNEIFRSACKYWSIGASQEKPTSFDCLQHFPDSNPVSANVVEVGGINVRRLGAKQQGTDTPLTIKACSRTAEPSPQIMSSNAVADLGETLTGYHFKH